MNLTYKQLAEALKKLTPEQMDMNVTVSLDITKEALPVKYLMTIDNDDFLADVLDEKHPVLAVDF